ncbi:MAG: hypothetical protein LAP39_20855 [Acidobacteriia bacterium]|nr:hypothetical protein [Terriglobia bacterium]
MNGDSEDLRKLWQSQPIERASTPAPRFSLLEDSIVPDYLPLSWGRRVSYLVGFFWVATQYWHGARDGSWPVYMSWLGSILAIAGSVLVLRERNRSRQPCPEESVQSYRRALADEFDRQFKGERRILLLLLAGWVLVGVLRAMATLAREGTIHASALALPAVLILLLLAGVRMYYRAANVVRSRLTQI